MPPTSGMRGPTLVISRPAIGEATIIIPVSGSRRTPAETALNACTFCRKNVTKNSPPKNAKAISTISTVPADSGTDRKMPSGISGSRDLVSQKAKTANSSTEPPMKAQVPMEPQPQDGALIRPQTRQNIAPDSSTMPGMSKDLGAFSARLSFRISRPISRATAPTGTLTKNTACQLTCSTSRPPTIGPAAVEAPMTAPQMPMAVFSFSAGKVARSRPRAAGWSRAPNRPWKTRSAMTAVTPCDRPISPEVSAKPAMPIRNV